MLVFNAQNHNNLTHNEFSSGTNYFVTLALDNLRLNLNYLLKHRATQKMKIDTCTVNFIVEDFLVDLSEKSFCYRCVC